jgi:hypothetical protein
MQKAGSLRADAIDERKRADAKDWLRRAHAEDWFTKRLMQ